jgi:hypothetical protein
VWFVGFDAIFFHLQVFFNYLVIEHDEFYNGVVQMFECEGTGHQCPCPGKYYW